MSEETLSFGCVRREYCRAIIYKPSMIEGYYCTRTGCGIFDVRCEDCDLNTHTHYLIYNGIKVTIGKNVKEGDYIVFDNKGNYKIYTPEIFFKHYQTFFGCTINDLEEHGCPFCNDMRNIEPASYVGGGDDEFKNFIAKARENKQFVYHFYENGESWIGVIEKCPVCGYEFTKEDYDNYDQEF